MAPRNDDMSSVMALLEILRRMPKVGAISTKDIQNHLADAGYNLSDRTVQRYMNLLSEHFDIKCDARSKPYGYRWESYARGLEIPILNEQESLLLMLAKAQLEHLLPPNVMASVQPFFVQAERKLVYEAEGKPEREWLGKIAVVPTSQPLLPPPTDKNVLDTIGRALYQNRWLDIYYRNQAGREHDRRVMPLALVQQGSVLYLVVQYDGYEDKRHLAVHRIRQARISTMTFQRPPFDLAAYCNEARFGYGDGSKIRLTFSIRHGAGYHLTETKLAENQIILEEDQEHYRIQAELVDSDLLDKWLLGFGDDIWDIEKIPL